MNKIMTQNTKIALAFITGIALGCSISKLMDKSTAINPKKDKESNPKKSAKPKVESELKIVKDLEDVKRQSKANDEFPLQLGSEGERVKRLQIFLMRNLGWVRQPNGKFDLITQDRTGKYFKKESMSQEIYEKYMLDKMIHDQRLKKVK